MPSRVISSRNRCAASNMMLFGKRVEVTVSVSADLERTTSMKITALDRAITGAPMKAVTFSVDAVPDIHREIAI